MLNWHRKINNSNFPPIQAAIEIACELGIKPASARAILKKLNGILWEIISNEPLVTGDSRGRKKKDYKAYVRVFGTEKVHENLQVDTTSRNVFELPACRLRVKSDKDKGRSRRRAYLLGTWLSEINTPISSRSITEATGVSRSTIRRYRHKGLWRVKKHIAYIGGVVNEQSIETFLRDNPSQGFFRKDGKLYKQIGNSYHVRPKYFIRRASFKARKAGRSINGYRPDRKPRVYFERDLDWLKYRWRKLGTELIEPLENVFNWSYYWNFYKRQYEAVCQPNLVINDFLLL